MTSPEGGFGFPLSVAKVFPGTSPVTSIVSAFSLSLYIYISLSPPPPSLCAPCRVLVTVRAISLYGLVLGLLDLRFALCGCITLLLSRVLTRCPWNVIGLGNDTKCCWIRCNHINTTVGLATSLI